MFRNFLFHNACSFDLVWEYIGHFNVFLPRFERTLTNTSACAHTNNEEQKCVMFRVDCNYVIPFLANMIL